MTDRVIVRNDGSRVVVRTTGPTGDSAAFITHASRHAYTGADPITVYPPATSFPRITELDKTVLTTFQSGHGYTTSGTGTSDLNYTSDYALGTQCVKATTNGAGNVYLVRKLAFTAVDCTGKMPLCTFKIENPNELTNFQLYLGDATLTNYYRWEMRNSQGQKWAADGEWVTISLSWGDATITGSPTRSSITSAQYRVVDTSSGTGVTYYLNEISLVPEPTAFTSGVITFTCDDGGLTQYTTMRPALDKYRYAACAYLIEEDIDVAGTKMTTTQLKRLRDSGWDLGLHASDAWTTMTPAAVTSEAYLEREWLVDTFGPYGVTHAALPLGEFQPRTTLTGAHTLPSATITVASTDGFPDTGTIILPNNQKVAYTGKTATTFTGCTGGTGSQVDAARVALYGGNWPALNALRSVATTVRSINTNKIETWPPADPYKLRVSYVTGTSSGETLTTTKAMVDKAKTNKEWLIFVFHNFIEGTTTTSGSHTLPVGTINVASTSTFPSSGALWVNLTQYVTYSGKTSTTFTGCSGGTGVIGSGSDVRAAGTQSTDWGAQDFRELVDYINTQAVPVRTFSNLARS